MLPRILSLILILLLIVGLVFAQDGIPDNCEYTGASYQRAEIFARYEPQNQRLVLMNWNTGAEELVLATGLADTLIRAWSADCHYLAVATVVNSAYNTRVYDTLNAEFMGEVAGANAIPHPITWGFDNYLVVETRASAILWHVPTGQQIPLAAAWNDSMNRNFSRLRWNAEHRQLIANLAVGGRAVYDMNTGQIVPEVAENTDSIVGDSADVVIGSASYDCNHGTGFQLVYDLTNQSVYVELQNGRAAAEILVTLETHFDAAWLQSRGWSSDCRYIAASVGRKGADVSDTYVWDVTTGQQVGIIPDAHEIVHPLYWHPTLPYLLVETRQGAILWYLPTNQQMQVNTAAETPLTGSSDVLNFVASQWLNQQIALRFVGEESKVSILNLSDGQVVERYQAEGIANPYFRFSPDEGYIFFCCNGDNALSLWNRQTGAQTWLRVPSIADLEYYSAAFSSDNHYFAYSSNRGLFVWDIQNPRADGLPTYHYPDLRFYTIRFTDGVTIISGYQSIDVRDGILRDYQSQRPVTNLSAEGQTGYSQSRYSNSCGTLFIQSDSVNERVQLINSVDNRVLFTGDYYAYFSPDCRWLIAYERFVPNSTSPYDAAPVDDVERDQGSEFLLIIDTSTGQEVQRFANPYQPNSYGGGVYWSPNGERAIVTTTEGYFLYHFASDTALLLTYQANVNSYEGIFTASGAYWDYSRGLVYLIGRSGLMAFELETGQQSFLFLAGRGCYWGCGNYWIENNQYLYISGFFSIAIWDLDSRESIYLQKNYLYHVNYVNFLVNPSRQYAVYAHANFVMVWDLQHLPEDFNERDPIFVFNAPALQPRELRFVDETTLQFSTIEGTYQMNILTGEYQEIH